MTAELVFAPEAELDIAEAYAWYERRRAGLGEEFLSALDACIESIRRQPLCGKISGARCIQKTIMEPYAGMRHARFKGEIGNGPA